MGCEFESYTCHDKKTPGEEGNGKPAHKFHFPRETQGPVSGFLLNTNSRTQDSFFATISTFWSLLHKF